LKVRPLVRARACVLRQLALNPCCVQVRPAIVVKIVTALRGAGSANFASRIFRKGAPHGIITFRPVFDWRRRMCVPS
jgi:hypothetical protein